MSPLLPKGGRHCFGYGSRWHQRSFFSVSYFLNQWMDFDQSCIDILMGEGNKLIRFW